MADQDKPAAEPVRRGPPPSPKTIGAGERIVRGQPGTYTTDARPGVTK